MEHDIGSPHSGLSPRARGIAEINIAVLVFAGTSLFATLIPLPVTSIIFGRSAVAAVALLIFSAIRRIDIRLRTRRDRLVMLSLGVILALHWLSYFQALQVSSVAIGTISLHTYPIMTVLVEPLIDRKRLQMTDALLAGVVLVGIIVLVPEFSLQSSVSQGVLWGILSAALFTARNLVTRRYVQRFAGSTVMFYQTLVTALVLLPVVLARGGMEAVAGEWPQFLLLGTVFTALAQSLYAASLKHLSAKTVAIIATLLPLYGSIAAAVVLGEIPAIRTVVGGVIVLAAVLAETIRAARMNDDRQPQEET